MGRTGVTPIAAGLEARPPASISKQAPPTSAMRAFPAEPGSRWSVSTPATKGGLRGRHLRGGMEQCRRAASGHRELIVLTRHALTRRADADGELPGAPRFRW